MNNKIILAGAVVVLAAIASLFMNYDIDQDLQVPDADLIAQPIKRMDAKVEYMSSTPKAVNQHKLASVQKPPVVVKEKVREEIPVAIGASTRDASGRYVITIADPTAMYKPSELPKSTFTLPLQGEINGKHYAMRIPGKLLEHPERVKVKILDSKTGQIHESDASFVYDLTKEAQSYSDISFDANDPGNYEVKDREPILRPVF